MKKLVICIMGPTGVGKSQLSLELATRTPAEIISVDSAMIYREMNIGTAKPSSADRKQFPHHLIDIRDPSEKYSAGDFCQDAITAIQSTLAKNKTPLLVGGTMLYFKALQQGLTSLPPANIEIRGKIAQEAKQKGWAFLHSRLASIDPTAASQIHPNDPQRIQRALEVHAITGWPISHWHKKGVAAFSHDFQFVNIAMTYENRFEIHRRIKERLEHMLKAGFLEEVESLYSRGDLHPHLPSIRSVGYRQIWNYLTGELDYESMKEEILIATRQLAKRQLTWLRSFKTLTWIYLDHHTLSQLTEIILNTSFR